MSKLPSLEIMIPLFTTEVLIDLSMKINQEIRSRQHAIPEEIEITQEGIDSLESQLIK